DFSDSRAAEIVQLCLQGCTYEEIASHMRVSIRTVYEIRRKERLDELVDYLRMEAARATTDAYMALRREAFRTASELLKSSVDEIRLEALDKVLRFDAARSKPANDPPHDRPVSTIGGTVYSKIPERSADELIQRARAAHAKRLGSGGR